MAIYRIAIVAALLTSFQAICATFSDVRANIFQWEYINPANPSLGKQQSTTLAPDGAGAVAMPAANLAGRNLTKAYLVGADLSAYYDWLTNTTYPSNLAGVNLSQAELSNAYFDSASLAEANLSHSNLSNAYFRGANLSGVDLSNAEVRGAYFSAYDGATGLTAAQIYSTASYQNYDLTGVTFAFHDLLGANFANQNLTNAGFSGAQLTDADFSNANLTNADLGNMTNANLSGAIVRGARFGPGFTLAQLYSTASYQARDLTEIVLRSDFAGANFVGQNLTDAFFYGTLANADLSQANLTRVEIANCVLTNANFSQAILADSDFSFSTLSGANLTGATIRGADFRESNITSAQLYSTVDYQAHDLRGIKLSSTILNSVDFANQNLSNADFFLAQLSNADLSNADLTDASFGGTMLTGADLNGATIRGADFSVYHDGIYDHGGITPSQLYSTASYQSHDLTAIKLKYHDLSGANFAGQNLTDADFAGAKLIGANLTGAIVRGANFIGGGGSNLSIAQLYSTASYQAKDLRGIGLSWDFSGANLAGQDLSNAKFYVLSLAGAHLNHANLSHVDFDSADLTGADLSYADITNANLFGQNELGADLTNANLSHAILTNANLFGVNFTGANLSGAEVRGANFDRFSHSNGISLAQLYSTASYQARDLREIKLGGNNLAGVDLSHQNLTNADFSGDGYYYLGADLTGADLSGADVRGAQFEYANLTFTNTANLIQTNGHIAGLYLNSGEHLTVRDYDGNPTASPPMGPLPIVVEQQLTMDATGTLRLVFEADAWDSTISFELSIPVALGGGTLELTFAPEVDVASQAGRTFDLFDWAGVSPTGTFSVSSPYSWNLANLYTTGEVTLLGPSGAFPGDHNNDGVVNAADFVAWRDQSGLQSGYDAWRAYFGRSIGGGLQANASVPEPSSIVVLLVALLPLLKRIV